MWECVPLVCGADSPEEELKVTEVRQSCQYLSSSTPYPFLSHMLKHCCLSSRNSPQRNGFCQLEPESCSILLLSRWKQYCPLRQKIFTINCSGKYLGKTLN
ncbi:hypothetical protein GOODEAATRI_003833 [Goodea atripinnis]|uniref:Uncharacterized protein n=1 Tax=Goodea atripinnis TaxID=208336 RepID=A0ABV0PKZ3_9TELE